MVVRYSEIWGYNDEIIGASCLMLLPCIPPFPERSYSPPPPLS
jgi:hypothetical protein